METYREQRQRGTLDLPFARYRFRISDPQKIVANTHWHPEQEILYVKKGSIEVLIGKQTFVIGENEICFIAPNALHSVRTWGADTVYYALVFSYDLLALPDSHFFQIAVTRPMEEGRLAFPATLGKDDFHFSAVAQILDRICQCSKTDPGYKFLIFQSLITLYTELQDALVPADGAEGTTDNQMVKMCLDYMHTYYARKITLKQLAELVHLHPNYLCSLFKTYTGQTAFQQLLRIRLENAAALLEKKGHSISQVANLCGFDSVSFFSRKFKEVMGCTPKAYSSGSANK